MKMTTVPIWQARRTAAVAALLSIAMVAGVALMFFQPSHEQELFSSGSPHDDAALALQLIRAAPHATVWHCSSSPVCMGILQRP
jgi:hypothetical protein